MDHAHPRPLAPPRLERTLGCNSQSGFLRFFCGAIKQWGMAATLIFRRKVNKYDFYAN